MLEHLWYSLALLSAAVIFQSIVHYSLKRRKRLQEVQALNLQQQQQQQQHCRNSSNASLPDMDITCTTESLDGDEPPVFFELLSQTGSEMMSSSRSIETIVRERMDSNEDFFDPPQEDHRPH
uniref:Uncharacterized protein n=1 Tax=Amphora coffeiformis TaxID=265554 RepID=A0A7S3P543_9STRA|mmetsp:Transcript_2049/g.4469  ORF Transcript_2049/g.4469 Transcript_2049/m.4469 type:complete len:122 (+) Transcript_2049:337-702(+)